MSATVSSSPAINILPKATMTTAAASSAAIPTSSRSFACIDLSDFDNRRDEIVADLMQASTGDGFFYGEVSIVP